MKLARCRVIAHGCVVNDDEMPNADEEGWITVTFNSLPSTLIIEWAPWNTPLEPQYPYRTQLVTQLDDSDESYVHRLSHLGFSTGLCIEDRIRAFQRFYRYTQYTGLLEHIKPELKRYHDECLLPVVHTEAPRPDTRHQAFTDSYTNSSYTGSSNGPRPIPTVPDSNPPIAPPTKGQPKAGGYQQQGQVTVSGGKYSEMVVSLRARFAHDQLLTSRWSDNKHLNSMRGATVELELPDLGLNLTAVEPSSGSWHDHDGVIKVIHLTPFHNKGPSGTVDGFITITPSPIHTLPRPGGSWYEAVTPADKNSIQKVHHLLLRKVQVNITLASNGKVIDAINDTTTEDTLPNGSIITCCRAIPKGSDNTVLVDWRPDFIQCKYNKQKDKEYIVVPLQAGSITDELLEDEFIVIHQTETPSGATIGSTLNLFTNTSKAGAAHYVIDTDGFTVKMANEATRVTHAGGTYGSAWRQIVSRTAAAKKANARPSANIHAFNNITVGIEHVHGPATGPKVSPGGKSCRTQFTKNQLSASYRIIRLLRPIAYYKMGGVDNIVTHNQLYLTTQNSLGNKPNCPGTGYDWNMLEAAQLARQTRFSYTFYSPADLAIEQYLIYTKPVIDKDADNLGHILHIQKSLKTCGYFVSASDINTDKYDTGTIEAIRAFILRHFSGKGRASYRSKVLDTADEPIVNMLLVKTILASAQDC